MLKGLLMVMREHGIANFRLGTGAAANRHTVGFWSKFGFLWDGTRKTLSTEQDVEVEAALLFCEAFLQGKEACTFSWKAGMAGAIVGYETCADASGDANARNTML
mmetsp:Transcript_45826/g.80870  ORF Transcript_45826/g.80870 Transcript_45826/m.80870 type:complete len:105 (+) Transcript_45826:3-317(+)